jgi:hypothetical protein
VRSTRLSPAVRNASAEGVYVERQVGTFDFQTLLVNLAGGAGLLAMGAVIVDFIALYLAPGVTP